MYAIESVFDIKKPIPQLMKSQQTVTRKDRRNFYVLVAVFCLVICSGYFSPQLVRAEMNIVQIGSSSGEEVADGSLESTEIDALQKSAWQGILDKEVTRNFFAEFFTTQGSWGETDDGTIINTDEEWHNVGYSLGISGTEAKGVYGLWQGEIKAKQGQLLSGDTEKIAEFFEENFDETEGDTLKDGTKITSNFDWEAFAKKNGVPAGGVLLLSLYQIWRRRKEQEEKYGESESSIYERTLTRLQEKNIAPVRGAFQQELRDIRKEEYRGVLQSYKKENPRPQAPVQNRALWTTMHNLRGNSTNYLDTQYRDYSFRLNPPRTGYLARRYRYIPTPNTTQKRLIYKEWLEELALKVKIAKREEATVIARENQQLTYYQQRYGNSYYGRRYRNIILQKRAQRQAGIARLKSTYEEVKTKYLNYVPASSAAALRAGKADQIRLQQQLTALERGTSPEHTSIRNYQNAIVSMTASLKVRHNNHVIRFIADYKKAIPQMLTKIEAKKKELHEKIAADNAANGEKYRVLEASLFGEIESDANESIDAYYGYNEKLIEYQKASQAWDREKSEARSAVYAKYHSAVRGATAYIRNITQKLGDTSDFAKNADALIAKVTTAFQTKKAAQKTAFNDTLQRFFTEMSATDQEAIIAGTYTVEAEENRLQAAKNSYESKIKAYASRMEWYVKPRSGDARHYGVNDIEYKNMERFLADAKNSLSDTEKQIKDFSFFAGFATVDSTTSTADRTSSAQRQVVNYVRKLREIKGQSAYFDQRNADVDDIVSVTAELKNLDKAGEASPYQVEMDELKKKLAFQNGYTNEEIAMAKVRGQSGIVDRFSSFAAAQGYLNSIKKYRRWTNAEWRANTVIQNGKKMLHYDNFYGTSNKDRYNMTYTYAWNGSNRDLSQHRATIDRDRQPWDAGYQSTLENIAVKAYDEKFAAFTGNMNQARSQWQTFYKQHPLLDRAQKEAYQKRLAEVEKLETERLARIAEQKAHLEKLKEERLASVHEEFIWLDKDATARATDDLTQTITLAQVASNPAKNVDVDSMAATFTEVEELSVAEGNLQLEDSEVDLLAIHTSVLGTKTREEKVKAMLGNTLEKMKSYGTPEGRAYTDMLNNGKSAVYQSKMQAEWLKKYGDSPLYYSEHKNEQTGQTEKIYNFDLMHRQEVAVKNPTKYNVGDRARAAQASLVAKRAESSEPKRYEQTANLTAAQALVEATKIIKEANNSSLIPAEAGIQETSDATNTDTETSTQANTPTVAELEKSREILAETTKQVVQIGVKKSNEVFEAELKQALAGENQAQILTNLRASENITTEQKTALDNVLGLVTNTAMFTGGLIMGLIEEVGGLFALLYPQTWRDVYAALETLGGKLYELQAAGIEWGDIWNQITTFLKGAIEKGAEAYAIAKPYERGIMTVTILTSVVSPGKGGSRAKKLKETSTTLVEELSKWSDEVVADFHRQGKYVTPDGHTITPNSKFVGKATGGNSLANFVKTIKTKTFNVLEKYKNIEFSPKFGQNQKLKGKIINEYDYYNLPDNSDILFDAPYNMKKYGLNKIRHGIDELPQLLNKADDTAEVMYVLKENGELVFSLRSKADSYLPHPVLSQGQGVKVAGTLEKSGNVWEITNKSGHFKPSVADFDNPDTLRDLLGKVAETINQQGISSKVLTNSPLK